MWCEYIFVVKKKKKKKKKTSKKRGGFQLRVWILQFVFPKECSHTTYAHLTY